MGIIVAGAVHQAFCLMQRVQDIEKVACDDMLVDVAPVSECLNS